MGAHNENSTLATAPSEAGLHRGRSLARFGVLGFISSLSLITYLDRICISRARVDIESDLGFTRTQMGWVFSAFLVGYVLFEIPGGWMGDRWGSRRALTRIVLCWSLFTALTGCVWSFHLDSGLAVGLGDWQIPLVFDALALMLLVRFLFGAGEAGAYPNLTRVVSDWFPFQQRAMAQGCVWMSARLGGAIAPLVLGRLAAWLGWRPAFWLLGSVGVLWTVFFWIWFRDRPCTTATLGHSPTPREEPISEPATGPDPLCTPRGWVTVAAMCFAAFWVCFGWYFYPTWLPLYLEEVHHFRPTGWEVELLTGLPFLCGAVGSLLGGVSSSVLVSQVGRRWGRSLVGLAGFSGAGLCVLGTGFVNTTWQAVALLCLASLINDLAIPVIWAVCADVGGQRTGTLAGLMNSVGGVGAFLSPILIPCVLVWLPTDFSNAIRWRVIFVGLAGAWFMGAFAWLLIDASISSRIASGESSQ